MKKIMQGRSRVLQAVIFGFGLSVFWALLLPEMVSADALVDSISGEAIDQDGNPVFQGMVIKEGDTIQPEIDAVVRVSCDDRTVRTVEAGVRSGLGVICPPIVRYGTPTAGKNIGNSTPHINRPSTSRSSTFESRGNNCSSIAPNVLAPVFDRPIATTSANYPTFLFFVPTTSARQAQFVLKSRDHNKIYRQTFALSGQSGILRVTLPTDSSIGELAVGKTYKWEFNIICDPDDRSKDDFVVDSLQRIPLPNDQLPISLRDRLSFYRVNGLNYDELIVLDALRREYPKDGEIQTYWEWLLVRYKLGDLKRLPAIK